VSEKSDDRHQSVTPARPRGRYRRRRGRRVASPPREGVRARSRSRAARSASAR